MHFRITEKIVQHKVYQRRPDTYNKRVLRYEFYRELGPDQLVSRQVLEQRGIKLADIRYDIRRGLLTQVV